MQRNWTKIKDYEDIRFEFFEGIAKITICREKVRNAFRPQTNKEMLDAFAICRETPEIGVVVLTGQGDKAFCSGGDQNYKSRGGYVGDDGVPRLNVLDLHKAIRSLLVERNACEQRAHVVDGVDGDARHADVAGDARMVGVIAAMGGKIERDRKTLLAGCEVAAIEGVGVFRR